MSKTRPQIRIRSAADLFDSLRHAEATIRLPALAAVAEHAEQVMAYGRHQGLDVVDELIRQLEEDAGLFAPAVLGTLVAFQDERVVAACCRVLEHACHPRLLELACQRLAREESPLARERLVALLRSHDPARATVAAGSLRGRADLTVEEKVYLALWLPGQNPDLNDSSRALWLDLLDGPLQARARRCLEEQGPVAFQWLVQVRRLDAWLLEWGCAHFSDECESLLEKALATDLATLALQRLAAAPERFPRVRERARAYLSDPDPVRRGWAWQAVPPGLELDWSAAWEAEADAQVRLAMGQRMAEECSQDGPLRLLAESTDWRLRSLATAGLLRLGALGPARELALREEPEVKAVGTSVLLALEDYEWMEEKLL